MPDYGKSVRWPAPPLVLSAFVKRLRHMHSLWRAKQIVGKIPDHLRANFNEKVAAFEMLHGKRNNWGYERYWLGDYLSKVGLRF